MSALLTLVLELCGVAVVDGHRRAVDVELAHHGGGHAAQLWAERLLGRQLAETQKADENVQAGVLVRQEGLPAAIGSVVAADELDLVNERVSVGVSGGTWK